MRWPLEGSQCLQKRLGDGPSFGMRRWPFWQCPEGENVEHLGCGVAEARSGRGQPGRRGPGDRRGRGHPRTIQFQLPIRPRADPGSHGRGKGERSGGGGRSRGDRFELGNGRAVPSLGRFGAARGAGTRGGTVRFRCAGRAGHGSVWSPRPRTRVRLRWPRRPTPNGQKGGHKEKQSGCESMKPDRRPSLAHALFLDANCGPRPRGSIRGLLPFHRRSAKAIRNSMSSGGRGAVRPGRHRARDR